MIKQRRPLQVTSSSDDGTTPSSYSGSNGAAITNGADTDSSSSSGSRASSKKTKKMLLLSPNVYGIVARIVIVFLFLMLLHQGRVAIMKNGGGVASSRALLSTTSTTTTTTTTTSSIFPLSIRTNKDMSFEEQVEQLKDEYEVIFHPAEQSLNQLDHAQNIDNEQSSSNSMVVPIFWKDASLHRQTLKENSNHGLMARSQALSIGSKIIPTSNNNKYYTSPYDGVTDIDPYDENGLVETIFVMIASYRDEECPHTVQSIFARAAFPERVRVAIVDQRDLKTDKSCYDSILSYCDDIHPNKLSEDSEVTPEEAIFTCKYYRKQIDVYDMDAQYGVGPVYARHVGYRMYRGEYYTLQMDAHVFFVKEWDVQIIHQFKSAGNEMAVLSTYLSDIEGNIDPVTHMSKAFTRPIMCNTIFEGFGTRKFLRNDQQPEGVPNVKGSPQLAPYWAAGFSFARGHFVMNVPYDQYMPMIFQGEEINIGLRGFTYGYDYYAPEYSVCFHMYASGKNEAKRKKIKMFWEHGDRYPGVEDHAQDRNLGITQMNTMDVPATQWDHTDEDKYGLGTVRDVHQFYDIYGIDIVNKNVQHHLCEFVNEGNMHPMFVQHLRPDGMGIDYSKITYKFKEPNYNIG